MISRDKKVDHICFATYDFDPLSQHSLYSVLSPTQSVVQGILPIVQKLVSAWGNARTRFLDVYVISPVNRSGGSCVTWDYYVDPHHPDATTFISFDPVARKWMRYSGDSWTPMALDDLHFLMEFKTVSYIGPKVLAEHGEESFANSIFLPF